MELVSAKRSVSLNSAVPAPFLQSWHAAPAVPYPTLLQTRHAAPAVPHPTFLQFRTLHRQYPRPAFVPTDLADLGALARNLAAAGFDAARPALFTCEGIFCYLPQVSTRATPFGYACV